MKTRAVSMFLLMIASALAGCTSGDPDGDGEMGIDTDVLNQMIEDNLQDFINNTSVTVHQEIHYHNNTTYVDNSESNMNLGGGSGANGSLSGSIMQVMRIQEDYPGTLTDTGQMQFMSDGILLFPAIGFAPTMIYNIGGSTYSMSFTCEEVVNARLRYIDWEDWAREGLGMSYSDADSLGGSINNDLRELDEEIEEYCNWQEGEERHYLSGVVFSMDINEGESVSMMQVPNDYDNIFYDLSCDDGYYEYDGLWNLPTYIGGWTDCTYTVYKNWTVNDGWTSTYSYYDENATYDLSNWIDWYAYRDGGGFYWYEWEGNDGSNSFDGIFYFTKYFVVPVE